jgi:haloacetate dehalogenase
MAEYFSGFDRRLIEVSGSQILARIGGSGPPLLLLHGCPQSHLMWRKLAGDLAEQFTVVASDLRGYGDSSKPRGLPDHQNYAFRAMATDQIEVMRHLGFPKFSAMGHDRGARVLHRMALDHPTLLDRVVLLDILPTSVLYEAADRTFACAYWEWFFFIQAADFPETLLAANPESFLRHELGALVDAGVISSDVWQEYLRVLSSKEAMHAMCEDYRAGASIDLEHDAVDAHRRIEIPLLLLWGARNPIWSRFDMLDVWRRFAASVTGSPIDSGHYLPEEAPLQVLGQVMPFLATRGGC